MAKKEPTYAAYSRGILDGSIPSGEPMRQAARRFIEWQEREDIEFRHEAVDRVVRFFGILRHFKDSFAGKPFLLEPWQQFIVACIYGFYYRGTGVRVCNNVYIEVSRKNGKTAFAAGLCLYHLIGDGVHGAEVDMVANSREQASIAFDFASKFATGLNTNKRKRFRALRKELFFDETNSKMNVFATDVSRLDGYNASMYLIDEFHAAKDTQVKDVLQSSQANRKNPLEVIITTAGFDKNLPCYQYRETCLDVLGGVSVDDSLWAFIYTMDEDDDWRDEANWPKCTPNLGVSVNPRFLRTQVTKADTSPSLEVGIRTKTFNEWMDSRETWIPSKAIHKTLMPVVIEDHYDERYPDIYCGVDLSSTTDLTAVGYLAVDRDKDKYYFRTDYYLPSEAINESELAVQYREWVRRGHLKTTPGNVVDYEYILKDILAQDERTQIQAIGYDSWNATQFATSATNAALPMVPFSQSIGNFNRPTKELERLILSGKAVIDHNPITRYCFSNVDLRVDHNGNAKPDKSSKFKKIDGVIAMLEALGVYLLRDI